MCAASLYPPLPVRLFDATTARPRGGSVIQFGLEFIPLIRLPELNIMIGTNPLIDIVSPFLRLNFRFIARAAIDFFLLMTVIKYTGSAQT